MAEPLDPQVKAELKRILSKDINEIRQSEQHKAFLQARQDYIGQKEKNWLGDILTTPTNDQTATIDKEEIKQQAEDQSQKDLNSHLEVDEDEDEEEEAEG